MQKTLNYTNAKRMSLFSPIATSFCVKTGGNVCFFSVCLLMLEQDGGINSSKGMMVPLTYACSRM